VANTHALPTRPLAAGLRVTHRTSPFAFAIMLTLLIATIPWRRKQNFTGQFDAVVLAKSALLVFAVFALFWARGRLQRPLNQVSSVPLLIAGTYFLVATMGSMFFGSMIASAALALRATLIAYIVLLVLELVSPLEAVTALAYAMATLTVFAVATGTFVDNGRLSGRLLAISPNEIAFTAGFTLIFLTWQAVNGERTMRWHLAAIVVMAGIAVLTQSRTAIAILAMLVPLVALTGRRGIIKSLAAILVAFVPALYVLLFTDVKNQVLTRGGTTQSAQTLESRTIAWDAALRSPESLLQTLLGRGLSAKTVSVAGQYWTTQLLDSSWISAFVQAGVVGFTLGVILVLFVVAQVIRNRMPLRALWFTLFVLLVARSFTESGLFDASTSFVALMVVAIGATAAASRPPHALTAAAP
jgi:hypothetical protein